MVDVIKVDLKDKELDKIWGEIMESKDPEKTLDSQKKRAFPVRKYRRAQSGCEFYVEIAATGRKYPVASKRDGNTLREYLWEYIKNYAVKRNHKRGSVVSSQKQGYWHQEMVSLIHNFIMDLRNGFIPEGSKGKQLRPQTIARVRRVFESFNKSLMKVNPRIMLKDFFEPHEVKINLEDVVSWYEKKNQKGDAVTQFINYIHYFEYWLEELAKKKIEEKYLNQFNAKKEEIENNHSLNFSEKQRSIKKILEEKDRQTSEARKYLMNNTLVSTAASKQMKKVRDKLKQTKSTKKKPKYKDPLELIKDIENNLHKITRVDQLRTAFGFIINLLLMFRANEFTALKFSDFEIDENEDHRINDYLRVTTRDINGKVIIEDANKTNTLLNRCLDSDYTKYLEYLRHPIFSHHKTKYLTYISCNRAEDSFILRDKNGRIKRFKSKGRSFFEFLKDEGFDYLNKEVFPKNLKREFVMEIIKKEEDSINLCTDSLRESIKSTMKTLEIPYTAPHRTFRSSGVTSYILEHGATLKTIQFVMNSMGWSSEAMVMNYINDILSHDNKNTTSLAMASSKKSKSKVKNILKGLSAEELKELQDAMDKMK